MGIFGRKRRDAEAEQGEPQESVDSGEPDSDVTANTETADGQNDLEEQAADDERTPEEPAFSRARGPFDRTEVEQDGSWLDLGALWVPAVNGMQVQLQLDQAQVVTAVQLAVDGSVAQLQAFAAPRTGALWPDIRTEIALSISAQGGSAQVVDGPLGRELAAKMPKDGPDVRFLGVDGPRWFLRAAVSGPAATDDAAAVRLIEAVRGTVVVRGSEAMAPRELLPLQMPAQAQPATASGPAEHSTAQARADLKPFERGPEITEVR